MQLHELKRKTPNKRAKRVGFGGKRGKTSGRGTKGQKARAGHRIFPQVREKIKKLPKRRGYAMKSIEKNITAVNVSSLERAFQNGETVTLATLQERGLVRASARVAKILGDGELTKKISVEGCAVSASARAKIEAAGGTIR